MNSIEKIINLICVQNMKRRYNGKNKWIKQIDRYIDRQTDRQTGRQTDRRTDKTLIMKIKLVLRNDN